MKPYDNYEIHPCKRHEVPDSPGQCFIEQCEPDEADIWTLYGHLPEGGVETIGDFATREHAEDVFQRITGIPFGGPSEIAEQVRVMHAGQKLYAALSNLLIGHGMGWDVDGMIEVAKEAVAQAEGRAS